MQKTNQFNPSSLKGFAAARRDTSLRGIHKKSKLRTQAPITHPESPPIPFGSINKSPLLEKQIEELNATVNQTFNDCLDQHDMTSYDQLSNTILFLEDIVPSLLDKTEKAYYTSLLHRLVDATREVQKISPQQSSLNKYQLKRSLITANGDCLYNALKESFNDKSDARYRELVSYYCQLHPDYLNQFVDALAASQERDADIPIEVIKDSIRTELLKKIETNGDWAGDLGDASATIAIKTMAKIKSMEMGRPVYVEILNLMNGNSTLYGSDDNIELNGDYDAIQLKKQAHGINEAHVIKIIYNGANHYDATTAATTTDHDISQLEKTMLEQAIRNSRKSDEARLSEPIKKDILKFNEDIQAIINHDIQLTDEQTQTLSSFKKDELGTLNSEKLNELRSKLIEIHEELTKRYIAKLENDAIKKAAEEPKDTQFSDQVNKPAATHAFTNYLNSLPEFEQQRVIAHLLNDPSLSQKYSGLTHHNKSKTISTILSGYQTCCLPDSDENTVVKSTIQDFEEDTERFNNLRQTNPLSHFSGNHIENEAATLMIEISSLQPNQTKLFDCGWISGTSGHSIHCSVKREENQSLTVTFFNMWESYQQRGSVRPIQFNISNSNWENHGLAACKKILAPMSQGGNAASYLNLIENELPSLFSTRLQDTIGYQIPQRGGFCSIVSGLGALESLGSLSIHKIELLYMTGIIRFLEEKAKKNGGKLPSSWNEFCKPLESKWALINPTDTHRLPPLPKKHHHLFPFLTTPIISVH